MSFKDTIETSGEGFVTDIICEGEISGLVDGANSILIDEIRLTNDDFKKTFEEFQEEDFKVGLHNQPVPRDNYGQTSIPVKIPESNELRQSRPISVLLHSNVYPDINEIAVNIRIPRLMKQLPDGRLRKAEFIYNIEIAHNNNPFEQYVREIVNQKSEAGFIVTSNIDLPFDSQSKFQTWKIRINRETEDGVSRGTSDDEHNYHIETYLDSIIAFSEFKYSYPNTALCSLKFDAVNFPSLPERLYHVRLKKVKVPDGYTPTEYDNNGNVLNGATYPSVWDGTFAAEKVWTDNPVWIYYDLITNKRYGLGQFIQEENVDKWTLYSISKYSDELVDDGQGNSEPRFTCNMLLTEAEEAFNVINHFASVFRGISYWLGGKIFAVQDKPKDSIELFSNANVIDGIFNYSSTEAMEIHTVALVRWNDPEDFYKTKIEQVEDTEGIIKYGWREKEVAAFACTRRGQAMRIGKWVLLSERLDKETVTFEVGMQGNYSRPGDIIKIYDDFRLKQKQGGRTFDMINNNSGILLDRFVDTLPSLDYYLTLSIPKLNRDPTYDGVDEATLGVTDSDQIDEIRQSFLETHLVDNFTTQNGKTVAHTTGAFSEEYIGGIWTLIPSGVPESGAKDYRVLNLQENEEQKIQITASEYSVEKFEILDEEINTQMGDTIDWSEFTINPPTNLNILETGLVARATFTGSAGDYVSNHIASGRISGDSGWGDWERLRVETIEQDEFQADFDINLGNVNIEISVQAVQVGGARSTAVSEVIEFLATNPGTGIAPPRINVSNEEGENGNIFQTDLLEFNISFDSENAEEEESSYIKTIQYEVLDENLNDIVPSTGIDFAFVRSVIINDNNPINWPQREATINAKYINFWDEESTEISLTVTNPPPPKGDLFILSNDNNQFEYNIQLNGGTPSDFSGVLFWTSTNDTMPSFELYEEKLSLSDTLVHNENSEIVYTWFAAADTLTLTGLNINGPFQVNVGNFSDPDNWNLTLSEKIFEDNNDNEYKAIEANWDRYDSSSATIDSYDIKIESDYGTGYYNLPQPTGTLDPSFIYENPAPNNQYFFEVRAKTADGKFTDWSGPQSITVAKPKIRYLEVDGRSRFKENTFVDLHTQTITDNTGTHTVDFGVSNIISLQIEGTGDKTLDATNIVQGSTYLVYMKRETDNGFNVEFSSKFKFPECATSQFYHEQSGAKDVLSCFSVNTEELYSVGAIDFIEGDGS